MKLLQKKVQIDKANKAKIIINLKRTGAFEQLCDYYALVLMKPNNCSY